MEFKDLESYLRAKGLKDCIDFDLDVKNELIELNIDRWYFCSVAKYDNGTYEVFESFHGATWDEKGFYLTDGELWQYKVFKSLKRAIDFALKCKEANKLPAKPLKVW